MAHGCSEKQINDSNFINNNVDYSQFFFISANVMLFHMKQTYKLFGLASNSWKILSHQLSFNHGTKITLSTTIFNSTIRN